MGALTSTKSRSVALTSPAVLANEAAHARRRAVDVARRTPRSRPRGSFALTRARASVSCSWPRQRALHRPRDGQCTSASSQTSTPRPTAPCDSRPSLRQCPPVACGASARVRRKLGSVHVCTPAAKGLGKDCLLTVALHCCQMVFGPADFFFSPSFILQSIASHGCAARRQQVWRLDDT